ncbi:MAG: hypothetical protein AB7I27_18115 [Bacteriovoracaceae bacterium]
MKNTNHVLRASILTVLLASGATLAQTLPDEINYTQYLKVYENLQKILISKSADYDRLSDQKDNLQDKILQMEKAQRALPEQNSALQSRIDSLKIEVQKLNADIQALETILGQVVEDLKKLDAVIAQLQKDYSAENALLENIKSRRLQAANNASRLNTELQSQISEENQSAATLRRLGQEFNMTSAKKADLQNQRRQMVTDVQNYQRQLPGLKSTIATNSQKLDAKRPQLAEVRSKLDPINAQLDSEQKKLNDTDLILNDRKTKLASLRAELAKVQPEITRMQQENGALSEKIKANNAKMASIDNSALIAKRNALIKEIEDLNAQLANTKVALTAAQENIKPDVVKLNEYSQKIKEAQIARNQVEADRLKAERDAFEKILAPKRDEIIRLNKEVDRIALLMAPKNMALNDVNTTISKNEATLATLNKENTAAQAKIDSNNVSISQRSASTAGLIKDISDLESLVNVQQVERDQLAKNVINIKNQQIALNSQIKTLSDEIARGENENAALIRQVAEMEKYVNDFPENIRRFEIQIKQLDDYLAQKSFEISREEKLLARIQQDRVAAQNNYAAAAAELDRLNQQMTQQQNVVAVIRSNLDDQSQKRVALTRYNQDSLKKYDSLKSQLSKDLQDISTANKEIDLNNQNLAAINAELPVRRQELVMLSSKVSAAEAAKNEAQRNADGAQKDYSVRLSLYQKYLADASSLGFERASVGSQDGSSAGLVDAKTKAAALAAESAGAEAKWVALKRGYIRGEIAGYNSGYSIGIASLPDSQQGEADGTSAGLRRAKDNANLVLKPKFYLDELVTRIREAEVSFVKKNSSKVSEASLFISQATDPSSIPDLSIDEINQAAAIISSLDPLIERSDLEVNEVLKLRAKISQPQNIYISPDVAAASQNAKCDGVYKNVKDFVEACRVAYADNYKRLYKASHEDAFKKSYYSAFTTQINNVYGSELVRLYPSYLQEATKVANEVGVSAGKKEIYQQSFTRAEANTYAEVAPREEARVRLEASDMVTSYLSKNSALSVSDEFLASSEDIGLAPGTEAILRMVVKNAGQLVSSGDSIVRVSDISPNIIIDQRETSLGSIEGKKQAEVAVLKVKVSEKAVPGSKILIKGQIVHPGNDYSATRVEDFSLESVVKINPAADIDVKYETDPKVATFFGSILRHQIDLSIVPKFKGVDGNYTVSMEEVGTQFTEIFTKEVSVPATEQGVAQNVQLAYRLYKSARGSTVTLRFTVKNGEKVVKTMDVTVRPR